MQNTQPPVEFGKLSYSSVLAAGTIMKLSSKSDVDLPNSWEYELDIIIIDLAVHLLEHVT